LCVYFVNIVIENDTPTLKDICRHVVPRYAEKWVEIGLALGISLAKLSLIECDNVGKVQECCMAMFQCWLSQHHGMSCKMLWRIYMVQKHKQQLPFIIHYQLNQMQQVCTYCILIVNSCGCNNFRVFMLISLILKFDWLKFWSLNCLVPRSFPLEITFWGNMKHGHYAPVTLEMHRCLNG